MPRSSNQKLKLLYLSKIFIENTDANHALTIKELIDELAKYEIRAERKSLYDDIELLRVFGLDLCVVRDKRVRYYLGAHDFSLTELKLLSDAVQSSRFITQAKSRSLIKKLEALGSRHEASQLRRHVGVNNPLKAENEEIFCNVDMIYRAMSENRRICFKYFEWNADKRRAPMNNGQYFCASPWGLTWYAENYYMVAYDSQGADIKFYRVDKMMELYLDKDARESRSASFEADVEQYLKQSFGLSGEGLSNVRLSCDKCMADEVVDKFGREIVIAAYDDNFEFTAKVMLGSAFYSWLLGHREHVKVIAPDSVIQKIK